MFVFKNQVRVHYALTDQMGVVYHGNYADFYEIGRTEALRSLGITYKSIESLGFLMAVTDMHIRFIRPAVYDDLLTIVTILKEIPTNHKIVFNGEIYNEEGVLLSTATIILYTLEASTMRKCNIPSSIEEKLKPFFENDKK